ncbi:hypothetical protein J19TS2_11390 [Cohnella xylanilytica]|uniref:Uncharacterized protein n=1 Tax=Cohnella xylanilytica TaxID=557555 RepID=A0A841TPL4_9BACL|nr:hypothetical protein [Cohnella xylanilytica]MBB6690266.1 hypothetical protein [Cohnella xylanilytica]GIO11584.1 hypothetical protein J19TS2_11390 [Cohnella xylanilytica]
MGEAIVIWIIVALVSFLLLYYVIRTAIDESGLNRNLEEVKELLKELRSKESQGEKVERSEGSDKGVEE